MAHQIESFCTACSDTDQRIWLASVIGDWIAADELTIGHPELAAITNPKAKRCRELRQTTLRKYLRDESQRSDALQAMADLQTEDLDEYLEDALQGSPSGFISTALDIITQLNDPKWCPRVHKLFRRVDPSGQLPASHIWITALKFLLNHQFQVNEMMASLTKAGGTEVGEAVLLSLEHAPEHAMPLIRRALIADIPICRTRVAAILALIDAPWSKRELLGTLAASSEQERTADARAALLETGDKEAEKAVLTWEELNPHENEVGS